MNIKTSNKTALITGINGMDGSHLADFLLEKGYKVWYSLSPMERYNKVMKNFTPAERRGIKGMRMMAQYIIDNNITK